MNLIEILQFKYPEAFKTFPYHILIQDDGKGPYIKEWNVEGVEKPNEETLTKWITEHEAEFTITTFYKQAEEYLTDYINKTAQSKGYDNTLSITSYVNSTNEQWKAEAEAFIEWRDTVLAFAYNSFNDIANGIHSIPSLAELEIALPKIVWPN